MHPMHVRYQTAPHPDFTELEVLTEARILVKNPRPDNQISELCRITVRELLAWQLRTGI